MKTAARAIVKLATSALYRATRGRMRVYDSQQVQLAPIGSLTVAPEQSIHDPAVFGTYDLATQRIVTIADPTEGAFSLDQIKGDAQRQRAAGTALSIDRYALALSMLEQGRGICLDACTSAPRDDVRATIGAKGYAYRPIDLNATGDSGVGREDLTRLSFADGAIARIISCDTIEHIPDYPAAIAEMFRVLEPGGILIAHFPVYYFDKASGVPIRPGVDPWEHVRYFSAREMLALFTTTGFAVMRAHLNFDYGALLAVLAKPLR